MAEQRTVTVAPPEEEEEEEEEEFRSRIVQLLASARWCQLRSPIRWHSALPSASQG
ncbi:hypothetical protein FNV43_RR22847 [Rhamnella rubrinervis]|uniref:Uncharacterized protein n=1 Tax=Rhamnella rubrinervis TaxID=2594499 RepID=A0A8K0DR72_9ROSA|nr:hypothetical protein FNV43_RR22847 [Rhamnella rubrinervis]